MNETLSTNISLALQAVAAGVLVGLVVIPRLVFTSVKDNWGKLPGDIDKTYITVLKMAGLSLYPVWLLSLVVSLVPMFTAGNVRLTLNLYVCLPAVLVVIAGATALYTVGLKYDLHGASSLVRLLVIVIVSALFQYLGTGLNDFHGIFGIGVLPAWLSCVLTVLAASYIIEMVKLLDGMNGLASGTLAVTLFLLLLLGVGNADTIPAVIVGGALGVILPFWLMKMFSRKWRKVIMGNSGSYVMGFVLAYAFFSSFSGPGVPRPGDSMVIAFSIIMMPALDVLRVIGSRARDSRSIITPDRNQINFKLLRTGMPVGAIFPVYILLVVFFAGSAAAMLHLGLRRGPVILLEVALWVVAELVINHFIRSREKRSQREEWDRVYGRDAWNSNVPQERIAAKQLRFGTMGLPDEIIDGDELDFISDSMNPAEKFCKRAFDIFVSALCLVVFSPLFLLCYILIKLDDGQEAIYRQERIGRFGRPFNIYKFRTMRTDAESLGPRLSHSGGEDDPRLTRTGRFLRAHHLDELPQLWNVLTGDMTLIGYRPERKFYIDRIMEHDPRYAFLYQIRPGVTSYATLYNGYTDTMEKMLRRLELDLYYLAHRSWWFDLKILFLTFASIVFGKKF